MNRSLVKLALRARLETASGIPVAAHRVWNNARYTPTAGTPYIEEGLTMSPGIIRSFPASTGMVETPGIYIVRWYGLAGQGDGAIDTGVAAILTKLCPGWSVGLSDGSLVRISTQTTPWPGDILPLDDGFAVCTIKVPFTVTSTNSIAA